jgi:dipeptidyl aminopeptidase/acylaminoacyl peptidase
MAAIDALVSEKIADPDRLAITGYSYGGFMTAWMITQTDRFKAAVIGAPIVNHESDTGTSDVGVILRERHFGDFFRERDIYRRISPANYTDRVTTPTLLLHGEADDRCPLSQSEEFFAALMIAGKAPVQLVTYPGGSHGFIAIGRPSHRVDFNRRLVDWVERWTVGPARAE